MNNKNIYVVGGIVVVVLGLVAFFTLFNRPSRVSDNKVTVTPTEAVIPTVDRSVKVNLEGTNQNKEAVLSLEGIPAATTSVDYELSYNTKSQGLQGVIGTISVDSAKTSAKKKVTLGTCSSGTCVYHSVLGGIQVSLKFNGKYGEKMFEKEFELE